MLALEVRPLSRFGGKATEAEKGVTTSGRRGVEEERNAAPNVHRVLMTLGWRQHFRFDLTYVGRQRLAETTLAVRT